MDFPTTLWTANTDMHTIVLNWIYSLFFKPYRQYAHLANMGYWGNPDPYFGAVTPDFISCGRNGDVQIIEVKSFYRDDTKEFEYDCENVALTLKNAYDKYAALTPLDIIPYLNTHKAEREPRIIEVVFILPTEVLEECLPIIQKEISENLIIWTFNLESDPFLLKKVLGNHNRQALEEAVHELILTPYPGMLVRYFRNSNLKDIKRCFSMYLMHSCLQDQNIVFAFDDIDTMMVHSRPPLLGHLSKGEREDFWRRCLRFLVDVARVVEPSEKGPNYYKWRTGILRSPYYRESSLEKIEKALGGKHHE